MDEDTYVIRQSYIDDLGLTGSALLVYAFIAAKPATEASFMDIARRCGLSYSSVKRTLRRLYSDGLIIDERDQSGRAPKVWRAVYNDLVEDDREPRSKKECA